MVLGSGSDNKWKQDFEAADTGYMEVTESGVLFSEQNALYFNEEQVECLLTEYASE